jgi:hypothetical protein
MLLTSARDAESNPDYEANVVARPHTIRLMSNVF